MNFKNYFYCHFLSRWIRFILSIYASNAILLYLRKLNLRLKKVLFINRLCGLKYEVPREFNEGGCTNVGYSNYELHCCKLG